jgi:hypothetical protein
VFDRQNKSWVTGTWQHAPSNYFTNDQLFHGLAVYNKGGSNVSSLLEVYPAEEDQAFLSAAITTSTFRHAFYSSCSKNEGGVDGSLLLDTEIDPTKDKQRGHSADRMIKAPPPSKSSSLVKPPPLMWHDGRTIRSSLKGKQGIECMPFLSNFSICR